MSKSKRSFRSFMRAAMFWLCFLVLISGVIYTVDWLQNRERIRQESEQFSNLYPAATEEPMIVTEAPTHAPSPAPTIEPTSTPIPMPIVVDVPIPTADPQPEIIDVPIPTPDASTVVYAIETPPPVQESFAELLEANPETVGFLRAGKIISLPVVQRKNDNDHYLNHTFAGVPSSEGTLFLDGFNQLAPEDDCLIIYGHNMNNGTMFGNLRSYLNREFFRSSGVVAFDTIYKDQFYVPFAAFNASMKPGDNNYVDIRRYLFSESEFDGFVSLLQAYSAHNVPVDVQYGDQLLLLVTCDYSNSDGRFILALRRLREGETPESVQSLIAQAN